MRGVGLGIGLAHRAAAGDNSVDPGMTGIGFYLKLDANPNDSSGNAHNGTATGASYGAPAKIGAGALLGGSVRVASTGIGGSTWTVCAWMRTIPTDFDGYGARIEDSDDQPLFYLKGNAEGENSQTFCTAGGVVTSGPLLDDTYYHVAVTYSGGVLSLWVNAVLIGSTSGDFGASAIRFVSAGDDVTSPIDEVAGYGRALVQAEFNHLASGSRPGGLV